MQNMMHHVQDFGFENPCRFYLFHLFCFAVGFFFNYFLITWFHCTHYFLFTLYFTLCYFVRKQPILDHLVIQQFRLRHQNKILFDPSNKVCPCTFHVCKCPSPPLRILLHHSRSYNPMFIFKIDAYNMAFEPLASPTYTFSQNTFCSSFLINTVSLKTADSEEIYSFSRQGAQLFYFYCLTTDKLSPYFSKKKKQNTQ